MTKILVVNNSTTVKVKDTQESKVIIMSDSTDTIKVALATTTI